MPYRVVNAAGIMRHRKRAVNGRNHLRQAAGFKQRGHENKIRSRVSETFQFLIKIADSHPFVKIVKSDNIFEMTLKIPVCRKYDLQILIPVFGDNFVKNFCQQLTAFLNRIQSRGPEKQRRILIFEKPKRFL